MDFSDLRKLLGQPNLGEEMHRFIAQLFPICRSITGDGLRATLRAIQEHIPFPVHEVPSGTNVFDWIVPLEWNIRDAYIANTKGERLVDFKKSTLHVVSYSRPIHTKMCMNELKEHLFTLPDHPDWIPYRTSYYKETWGFCLTHRQYQELHDEEYEVYIDSSLTQGFLTYGECYLPGQTDEEILISCHTCHPSLCNDNLSGIAVATFLAKTLSTQTRRYSYRFLFVPATIGSITWLALNRETTRRIKHGLVLTGLGDPGHCTYKKSRRGDTDIDRVMQHILKHSTRAYNIIDFFPYGYDERQYCSPGFNLPVGCFMRTPHGRYAEYHTSADNLDFVQPQYLEESVGHCLTGVCVLENNRTCVNLNPYCEPQLGKRGLYEALGGQRDRAESEMAMLWVLNLSDGHHSLLDIAEKANISFEIIHAAAEALVNHGLLRCEGRGGLRG